MTLLCFLDHYLRLKAKSDWRKKPLTFGKMKLGYVENYGAFKGLMKNHPKKLLKYQFIFVVCSLLYTTYVIAARKKSLIQIGWLLASLGGLNNLWERALKGYVTDYVSLNGKLYFNIADIFVFAGASMVFLGQVFDLASKPKTDIAITVKEKENE
ncbi:signal peptidase II [Clostridiales bacterium COT073_COT-073]|nr:signal peptidase II [Clostridiales bacterium COT073_COT-073]